MSKNSKIIIAAGCDRTSSVYLNSFNFLQPIMLNDESTITVGAITVRLDKADGMDLSALGVYIGKIVEQEINSSIVQLMRDCVGIEMPRYYCRLCHDYGIDTTVRTASNRTVRLDEYVSPKNRKTLKTIPLGDAYYALEALKDECPDFFAEYTWLYEHKFLEAWRNLMSYRNRNAHTGVIISRDELLDNIRCFNQFLEYMPDILELKRYLAPEGMFDNIQEQEIIQQEVSAEQKQTGETQKVTDELPYPPYEDAKRYIVLFEAFKNSSGHEIADILMEEMNTLLGKYKMYTKVFEENGKKGMKDILGNVIVPPRYDDFLYLWDQVSNPRSSMAAVKDGKMGLVKVDGSGEELTDFKYESFRSGSQCFPTSWYLYKMPESESYGIMLSDGKELTKPIIDKCYDYGSRFFYYKSGLLWGLWLDEDVFVDPLFDNIEVINPEDPTVFILNGQPGYLTWEGKFVSKTELESVEDEDERNDMMLDFIREITD